MSFRRTLLQQVHLDDRINENVAFHWELDIAQQIQGLGYKLLFDPLCKVDHFSAPREIDGMRTVNPEGIYWSNFNYALLMMKHLSLGGRIVYVLYSTCFGSKRSSGLAHLIWTLARGRAVDWKSDVLPSIRGRVDGIKSHFTQNHR